MWLISFLLGDLVLHLYLASKRTHNQLRTTNPFLDQENPETILYSFCVPGSQSPQLERKKRRPTTARHFPRMRCWLIRIHHNFDYYILSSSSSSSVSASPSSPPPRCHLFLSSMEHFMVILMPLFFRKEVWSGMERSGAQGYLL